MASKTRPDAAAAPSSAPVDDANPDEQPSAKLKVLTLPPVADPFRNDSVSDMPCWWKYGIQTLCGITLLPIRLSLLLFVIVPITLLALIPYAPFFDCCCCRCCIPAKRLRGGAAGRASDVSGTTTDYESGGEHDDPDDHPHGCCRSCAVYPLRLVSRAILWTLGVWWVSVDRQPGSARSARERPVVVANHTALLDAMFMNWFIAPMAVGKAAVKHIPIAGAVAVALQTIFVNRKDPNSKHKVLATIKRRTRDPRFPSLMIYPEGTCTNGKCLVQFKKGPFTAAKPVQPIVLRYHSSYLNVAACGDNNGNMFVSFLLMMCQPYVHLKATMMPVYTPSAAEKADAILFAGNVRAAMAKEMNVPVTEHSYEDVFFAMHMHKIHKEQVGNTFVIRAMKNKFGLTYDAIKDLMDKFAVATGADAVMDEDEFCRCLDLKPGTREAASLFHFFDNDDSGTVEFAEFVRGVALLSDKVDDVDRLKLAFAMLDADKDGKVSLNDLRAFLADAKRLDEVRGYVSQASSNPAAAGGSAADEVEVAKPVVPTDVSGEGAGGDVETGGEWTPTAPGGQRHLLRQSSLGECFGAIDADADGKVSFDEFVALAHERGTLAGPLLTVAKELVGALEGVQTGSTKA